MLFSCPGSIVRFTTFSFSRVSSVIRRSVLFVIALYISLGFLSLVIAVLLPVAAMAILFGTISLIGYLIFKYFL